MMAPHYQSRSSIHKPDQELANFSIKGHTVNILGSADHMVCDTVTQLCHYSAKAATNNT